VRAALDRVSAVMQRALLRIEYNRQRAGMGAARPPDHKHAPSGTSRGRDHASGPPDDP
jgi:hypothetical protein